MYKSSQFKISPIHFVRDCPASETSPAIQNRQSAPLDPFVWSLASKLKKHLTGELRDANFVSGANLIVPWVLQRLVLEHLATDVFLCHCGCNSTLEALCSGVPVIGWPLFADQGLNVELLEMLGTGREVRGLHARPSRLVLSGEVYDIIESVFVAGFLREMVRQIKVVSGKAASPLGQSGSQLRAFLDSLDIHT